MKYKKGQYVKKKLSRLLFSRYAICAFAILAEVLLLGLMVFVATNESYIFFILALIIDFITVFGIINRNANPEFKVTWVIVVLLLPLFGALLYLIFYRRRLTRERRSCFRTFMLKSTLIIRTAAPSRCCVIVTALPQVRRERL